MTSDVHYRGVIETLGYGAHEERLDKYFQDRYKTVSEQIDKAEALVQAKTGKTFDPGNPKWAIYCLCVEQQAALLIIQAIRTYENNNSSMTVEGAVRFDKTALGRQLSSVTQKLENSLDKNVALLTQKVTPVFSVVTRPAY
jgi:hypothetical protein